MKWGYATTAAIVRSLQKDHFYRNQLESDLKLVLLDHISNIKIMLKTELHFRGWKLLEIGEMVAFAG